MVRKASITLALMGLSLLSFLVFQVMRPSPTTVVVKTDTPTGAVVRPVWTRMNVWDLSRAPSEAPAPFITEVILMTATGGRETSEMYRRGPGGSHNFSKLDLALNRVLSAGLHPTIVIGNTPEALSDAPGDQGAFDANVGAPTDLVEYSSYIRSLFQHLVGEYGAQAVRDWGFRLMTEPDNKDWWLSGRLAYNELLTNTVTAARSVVPGITIDPGNLMMPLGDAGWTEDLADWFAAEATVPRIGISCYARGQMGMDPRELGSISDSIRERMSRIDDLRISVDEGMILHDEEGKRLWLGDGTELGAAWNAAIIKVCLDHGVDRYVQWGFHTDGVKSPSYNAICMYERMEGDGILETDISGGSAPTGSYIDAISAVDAGGALRVLVFHYWPDRSMSFAERVRLKVRGLPAGTYDVEHLRVDRNHSNFFTAWLEDSRDLPRIDVGSGSGSWFDLAATNVLTKKGWEFWSSMKDGYLAMDDLESLGPVTEAQIDGEHIEILTLPSNSVSLLEFRPR